jgi:hypothetical protein
MQNQPRPKKPNMMGLAIVTYSLVIGVTLLSVASYYFYLSRVTPGDNIEADQTRRILVGAVWVPIYEKATYVEPASVQEKEIATGTVKFRTNNPAGEVLGFYKTSLEHSGYLTKPTGTVGGTLQAVGERGKVSVLVTVTSGPENTTGEIRTLRHILPGDAKGTSPAY